MNSFVNFMENTEKIKAFNDRTSKHIKLVQKYANKIGEIIPELKLVRGQTTNHDSSKYEEPEFTPYVEITWYYLQKAKGIDYQCDDTTAKATFHHVKNNSHHPEYHDSNATETCINSNDRDKPSNYIVDATKMPPLDIAEMCADWMAMSEEMGNSPIEWAKNNINIRWKFTEEQEILIYNIINKVWKH